LAHREQLEKAGFSGFLSFQRIHTESHLIPVEPGVYAVLTPPGYSPRFLEKSLGGWHKGKDPTVPVASLRDNWVEGVDVLYFGKADAGKYGRRGLRKRLSEYVRYGAGKPIGHSGGRLIWQLRDAQTLLVCWRVCDSPSVAEEELLRGFVLAFGRRPFANLVGGMK